MWATSSKLIVMCLILRTLGIMNDVIADTLAYRQLSADCIVWIMILVELSSYNGSLTILKLL